MRTWTDWARRGDLGAPTPLEDREVLLRKGDPATVCHFMNEGAVEIFHTSETGASVIVKIAVAPTILPSPELVVGEPTYLASIRSIGTAIVYTMNRPTFLGRLAHGDANQEAMIDIALAFTGAARFEPSRLHETSTLLAALLCAYAEVFGTSEDNAIVIDIRRSQSDLAGAIGASERSVNRVLTAWQESGVIDKRNARYRVLDHAQLMAHAGELAGTLVHRWREVR